MKNVKYCSFPATPAEALTALLKGRGRAAAAAGGTLTARTLPPSVEHFVDLKRLPLRRIFSRRGDLVIGALATFDEIDKSPLVRQWAGGAISAAAARCSSQLIRNMATIGGNIARPHSFNIFPVVLEGLEAKVRLLTRGGTKTFRFGDIYRPDFGLRPGQDCLILEIAVPAAAKGLRCSFEKFAKTESSWDAYVSLFMSAEMRGGKVGEARVAVGALSPKPFRALSAEKFLKGRTLDAAAIGEAGQELARDLDQARAPEFKKEAAAGLFVNFLSGLTGRSGGGRGGK